MDINDVNIVIEYLSKDVYDFMNKIINQEVELVDGRIDFEDGCYANIESYVTQSREKRQYESHDRYIDVQMVIQGEEYIEVSKRDLLRSAIPYDEIKDITFYHNDVYGEKILMKPFCPLLLYPEQGHMPCITYREQSKVRKIVFKIPVKKRKNFL